MGREIVYCDQCGTRLLEEDFEKRGAVRLADKALCPVCRPKSSAAPPKRGSEPRLKPAPRAAGHAAVPAHSAAPRRSTGPVVGLAVAGAVLVVGLAWLAWPRGGKMPVEPPPPPPPRAEGKVEEWLGRAKERQQGFATAGERDSVLEAFDRAAAEALGSPSAARVAEQRTAYLGRFDRAAEEAYTKCARALEEAKDDLRAAIAAAEAYPPAFASTEWPAKLRGMGEARRTRFAVGEWQDLFDGRSLAGWKRHATAANKAENWAVRDGKLVGRSSLAVDSKTTFADELYFEEPEIGDVEIEVTWTAEGDRMEGGKSVSGLAILPHIVITDGKRERAAGFVRAASGGTMTVLVRTEGTAATMTAGGKKVGSQTLNAARGRFCVALAPGVTVRVERVRVKRLK